NTKDNKESNISKQIVRFQFNTNEFKVPTVATNDIRVLNEMGKKSGIKVGNVYSYTSTSSTDLIYAEVMIENLEKRSSKAVKLEGYIQTPDGIYFPATVTSS